MRRQNGLIENCEFQCKKKKMQETAKICNFQLKIVNFVATISSLTGIPLQGAKASRGKDLVQHLAIFVEKCSCFL